jgi:(2R)-3-sulfolactate dehydrogenase (NADP+)
LPRLTLAEVEDLAHRALLASCTGDANARIVARSIAAAEADGIGSHGLLRLPAYCAHARSGKVDGHARPTIAETAPGTLRVDAANGFAHPAIEAALDRLVPLAATQGIAAASLFRSYNSGVMGHHVERLARQRLVGLGFSNAPAVIAPWGGHEPLFGTNPIAFAAPHDAGEPIVIDQACSIVARGEVLLRAARGEPLPDGWGLDRRGEPTIDPDAVLQGGSMLPFGGRKGATLALMVEVLAATLTGALRSAEAGSLTADDRKPAGIGQAFIALSPDRFAAGFQDRIGALCEAIAAQPGARLPGARRFEARRRSTLEGIVVDESLLSRVQALCA